MDVIEFKDVSEFRKELGNLLEEIEYNLIDGILSTQLNKPNSYSKILMILVKEGGDIRLVSIQTTREQFVFPLIVSSSQNHLSAVGDLFSYLNRKGYLQDVKEVVGPEKEIEIFVNLFNSLEGESKLVLFRKEMLHKLEKVNPSFLQSEDGECMVEVTSDQVELAEKWLEGFEMDISGHLSGRAKDTVKWWLANRSMYFWNVHGVPKSMGVLNRETKYSMSVSAVYTPKEYRRKGYASRIVASLSQEVLNRGKKYCTLFTDLANQTSNHIYSQVGYVKASNFIHYHVSK